MRPSIRVRSEAHFGVRSVVRIARAAFGRPSGRSARAAATMPASIFSIGSGCPITPVEATSTSSDLQPTLRAASAVIARASRIPRAPIATFEQPEFATIARATPRRTRSRESATGAPTTVERVNTPAACAGPSLTISARSGPRALMPQRTPAERKPGTIASSCFTGGER